jgi:hypothetical protein
MESRTEDAEMFRQYSQPKGGHKSTTYISYHRVVFTADVKHFGSSTAQNMKANRGFAACYKRLKPFRSRTFEGAKLNFGERTAPAQSLVTPTWSGGIQEFSRWSVASATAVTLFSCCTRGKA